MECQIEGEPRPVVSWLKDGSSLATGNGIDVVNPSENQFLSRVVIDSAVLENAGAYTCTGTNKAGSVSMLLEVDVKGELQSKVKTMPLNLKSIYACVHVAMAYIVVLIFHCINCKIKEMGTKIMHKSKTKARSYSKQISGLNFFSLVRSLLFLAFAQLVQHTNCPGSWF